MTSICLSLAPVLRCIGLHVTQDIILFIPSALQGLAVIALVIFKRGRFDRQVAVINVGIMILCSFKHLWLILECLSFTILSFLELLSHTLTSARSQLATFKAFDLFIASTSFLPLVFHIIYLFQLSQFRFQSSRNLRRVTLSSCILFLVAVIVTNELSSLLGISYGIHNLDELGIIFSNIDQRNISTVLYTVTLGLLTISEGVALSVNIYGLYKAIDQRRLVDSSHESMDRSLANRLIWFTVGMVLDVIEVIIGFAAINFSGALLRRVLKLLGRLCLIVGAAIEVDTLGEFALLNPVTIRRANSQRPLDLKEVISGPRLSTFERMTPEFLRPQSRRNSRNINDDANRRVTLQYDGQSAPKLDLRFSSLSNLNLPGPSSKNGAVFESASSREKIRRKPAPLSQTTPINTNVTIPKAPGQSPQKLSASDNTNTSKGSRFSFRQRNSILGGKNKSTAHLSNSSVSKSPDSHESRINDSLDRLHEIALQFPGPPPLPDDNPDHIMSKISEENPLDFSGTVDDGVESSVDTRRNSGFIEDRNISSIGAGRSERTYVDDRSPVPLSATTQTLSMTPELTTTALSTASSPLPQLIEVSDERSSIAAQGLDGLAVRIARYRQNVRLNEFPHSPQVSDYGFESQPSPALNPSYEGNWRSSRSMDLPGGPWVLQRSTSDAATAGHANFDEPWRTAAVSEVSRIKSFGTVAKRQTPTPSLTPTRSSVALDKQFPFPSTSGLNLAPYSETTQAWPERVSFEERFSEMGEDSDIGRSAIG